MEPGEGELASAVSKCLPAVLQVRLGPALGENGIEEEEREGRGWALL
jgi:hypothetical protein